MADTLGWEPGRIVSARQVHDRVVAVVGRKDASEQELAGVDCLVTREPGTLLLLKFADCVPVVIWDPVRQVVALVHAGWRGTVIKAPAAAVEAMAANFGSNPADLVAGIGPSIGPCCYEVGDEVVAAVDEAFGDSDVVIREPGKKARLDLWEANAQTLRGTGISSNRIEVAGICTRCRNDLFFSHRAEGSPAGRFAVVAGIRE
jgi:YfiH family protein